MNCPHCLSPLDDRLCCDTCGLKDPAAFARDAASAIRFSGNYVALLAGVTTRQFDETGTVRNELVERRSWLAPAQPVPAAALRSLSSSSFAPYQQPAQLTSGVPTHEGLRRLLEEFDVSEADHESSPFL